MSEILVEVRRGPMVESVHRGDIAVVDRDGRTVASVGDPHKVTFWRSSAKPVQVLSLIESGGAERFGFTSPEIAVMCASHSGEEFHLAAVRSILAKIGLTEAALACGSHLPLHEESAHRMLAAGRKAGEVHCNCSGKHSGMLALAVLMGVDVNGYWRPEHPVQQRILETIADLAETEPGAIPLGVDGCGVPVHGLSLSQMALAYARLSTGAGMSPARQAAARRVVSAMQSNPEMIAGTGRLCTAILSAGQAYLVAKGGAEAVYCVGHVDKGYGIAVKIEDGNSRATGPSILEALRQMGDLPESPVLTPFIRPIVKNHRGEHVGELVPAFRLRFANEARQALGAR